MSDVLAIICAYNEADILPWVLRHLEEQGCDVRLVDNWSTDGTVELLPSAKRERWPPTPSKTYDWEVLLHRVEQIAAGSSARWIIHHDADEIRRSPRVGETIAEGLARVEREGYNAINHTVVTYHPSDNGWAGQCSPEQYFTACSVDTRNTRIGQVKAWRNVGRVDLASSGGHQAMFPGRRVHPEPWLLKHYPIRSQQHGERKVFRERQPRWNPQERARDWHVQYDSIKPGHDFLVTGATTRL